MRVQYSRRLTDDCPTDSVRLAAQHCCSIGNTHCTRIAMANHALIGQHGPQLVGLGIKIGIVVKKRE